MSRPMVWVGAGLALGGLLLLGKKAGASIPPGDCFLANPNIYHLVTWTGSDASLVSAFGPEAWQVVFSVEFFDEEWWPAASEDTIVHTGEQIRFMLQEQAEVCGFRRD